MEVTAAACAAALEVAVEWVRLGGDLPQHVDEALAALGAVARRPPR